MAEFSSASTSLRSTAVSTPRSFAERQKRYDDFQQSMQDVRDFMSTLRVNRTRDVNRRSDLDDFTSPELRKPAVNTRNII